MSSKSLEERLLHLIQTSGYSISQDNGQRVFGPPPDWPQSRPPPKRCEVFIGRIPRRCFEDELIPLFARMGTIYKFRLMMDFSGVNRGYAFVTYTTRHDAIKAIKLLNDFPIRPNCRLGVVESKDNTKLFIGNLPKGITREEVIQIFRNLTEGVVDAVVYSKHSTQSVFHSNQLSFAFIEYETHRDAAMARRKIMSTTQRGDLSKVKLFGAELTIDWAIPEPNPDDETMSKVTALFVRHLTHSVTEDMIKELFSLKYIFDFDIKKVKRMKDFAFIHFNTRSDAELALNYISTLDLSSTKFEDMSVEWAKPSSALASIGVDLKITNRGANHYNFLLDTGLNPRAIPFVPKPVLGRTIASVNNGFNGISTQDSNPFNQSITSLSSSKGLAMFWPNLWPTINGKKSMPWVHKTPKTFKEMRLSE